MGTGTPSANPGRLEFPRLFANDAQAIKQSDEQTITTAPKIGLSTRDFDTGSSSFQWSIEKDETYGRTRFSCFFMSLKSRSQFE